MQTFLTWQQDLSGEELKYFKPLRSFRGSCERLTVGQSECIHAKHLIKSFIFCILNTRVFHITPFFELSLVLLTTHAHGLYEVTKKMSALLTVN